MEQRFALSVAIRGVRRALITWLSAETRVERWPALNYLE